MTRGTGCLCCHLPSLSLAGYHSRAYAYVDACIGSHGYTLYRTYVCMEYHLCVSSPLPHRKAAQAKPPWRDTWPLRLTAAAKALLPLLTLTPRGVLRVGGMR